MPELSEKPLTQAEVDLVQAPLEAELVNFFSVLRGEALFLLQTAYDEGWDDMKIRDELDKLLGGSPPPQP